MDLNVVRHSKNIDCEPIKRPGNCTNGCKGGKDGSIKIELYHLSDDPMEARHVAAEHSDRFWVMHAELEVWSHSLNGMDYASMSR